MERCSEYSIKIPTMNLKLEEGDMDFYPTEVGVLTIPDETVELVKKNQKRMVWKNTEKYKKSPWR